MILAGEEFADQHDIFDQDGHVTQSGGKQIDPVNFSRLTDNPLGDDDDSKKARALAEMRRRIFAYVSRLVKFRISQPGLSVNETDFIHVDFNDSKRVLVWKRGAAGQDPVGDVIPVFLVNTTMETYFQKGPQAAGALEQDDRLAPNSPPIDSKQVFGTESCVGCHYSSGVTIGFKKDKDGNEALTDGLPTAVFGENNHFGKTGGANFSWMLQLEAQPKPRNVSTPTKANLVPSTTTPKLPGVQN